MPQGSGSFKKSSKPSADNRPRAGRIAKPKSKNFIRESSLNKRLTSKNIKSIEETTAANATNLKLVQATGSVAKERRNKQKMQTQRKPITPKSGK